MSSHCDLSLFYLFQWLLVYLVIMLSSHWILATFWVMCLMTFIHFKLFMCVGVGWRNLLYSCHFLQAFFQLMFECRGGETVHVRLWAPTSSADDEFPRWREPLSASNLCKTNSLLFFLLSKKYFIARVIKLRSWISYRISDRFMFFYSLFRSIHIVKKYFMSRLIKRIWYFFFFSSTQIRKNVIFATLIENSMFIFLHLMQKI